MCEVYVLPWVPLSAMGLLYWAVIGTCSGSGVTLALSQGCKTFWVGTQNGVGVGTVTKLLRQGRYWSSSGGWTSDILICELSNSVTSVSSLGLSLSYKLNTEQRGSMGDFGALAVCV